MPGQPNRSGRPGVSKSQKHRAKIRAAIRAYWANVHALLDEQKRAADPQS